ncbi:hypothetical protein AYO21_09609 [Fonsecaea monophora]|uniref:Velvet complex subunit laeA n=3 Tax=Fonsecaea TaxID=40354 RepID=A0A0D2DBQ8_9EURO|nr:uncharacterized protein Z517_11772 [Fonsecaea pedrosoi CBS 271.37]XP_022508167.1 hypothetical protein AYO21_09609 [Fonsecaea monophora]KIW75001.1 hypothetical protein Z517_11772 [Fonsecaea pedrosoi CBS 271.37]OAG36215.1 hypothetical protein AYO21_09609 [Fonsecaea monophora]
MVDGQSQASNFFVPPNFEVHLQPSSTPAMTPELPPWRTRVQRFGREYGAYRIGQYMFPHDEAEKRRMDMVHTMLKVLRPKHRRITEVPHEILRIQTDGWDDRPRRPRVLDLGCGTGVWIIDMSHTFKDAEFRGVDIQFQGPPNPSDSVDYTVPWDYEGPWALGEASWDLIHLQMGLGSVANWDRLFEKIFAHLVPGGYFEWVEFDFEPRCDDGTLQHGKLTEWWDLYIKSTYEAAGRRLHWDPSAVDTLRRVGFRDVQHIVFQIPLNTWGKNEDYMYRMSQWWQLMMGPDWNGGGAYGLEAISLAPLCTFSNWPPDHVKRLCNEALGQAADTNVHVYNQIHIITARAPRRNEQ